MPVDYKFDSQFFGDGTQFDIKGEHTATISESSISVSDSVSRRYGAKRTLLESGEVGFFDHQFFGDVDQFDVQQDTIPVSDSITGLRGKLVQLNETAISVSDSIVRKLSSFRIIQETVVISESIARKLSAMRTILDPQSLFDSAFFGDSTQFDVQSASTNVSDSLSRNYGAKRTISESVSVSESIARKLSSFRVIAESAINVSDNISRIRAIYRTLSDSTSVSDSVERLAGFKRTISETVTNSESIVRTLGAVRALSDTVNISENLVRIRIQNRVISEAAITVSDSIAILRTKIRLAYLRLTKRSMEASITDHDHNAYLTKRDSEVSESQ